MVPLWRGRFGSREWRFLAASALPLHGGHGNASKDCYNLHCAVTGDDFENEELAKLNQDAGKDVNVSLIEAGGLTIKHTEFAEEKFKQSCDSKTNFKVSDKDRTLTNPATEVGGPVTNSMKMLYYQNPLLPLLARRRFSSKRDPEDNLKFSTKPICTKGFHGLGPGDTKMFLQNVELDKIELCSDLDIGLLKAEFERDIRPLLARNCLLLPGTLSDDKTAYLHGPLHGITNHDPLYLSSLDIMVRMKGLKKPQRKPLIDHIIQHRVLVSEDWTNSYGNIELLEYDFRESNTSFVRGECDASFERDQYLVGTGKVRGTGKVSIIIWKENNLLWAEVFEGIPCSEVHAAEVHAALALLKKCEEMKFENVELWSDSQRVIGVLSGELTIGMKDPDRDICLVLRSMQTKFTKLVAVLKPRELMFLADNLLRMDCYKDYEVKMAIKSWSPALRGCALFRITRNHWTSSTIKSFGSIRAKQAAQGYIYSSDSTFFLKVEKDRKFEELKKLIDVFAHSSIEVRVHAFEKKPPLLQSQLYSMFPGRSYSATGSTKAFGGNEVPNPRQRNLIVVWDACTPMADYCRHDTCAIIMAEEDEVTAMQKRGIKEINVETHLYLNRGEFKYGAVRKK